MIVSEADVERLAAHHLRGMAARHDAGGRQIAAELGRSYKSVGKLLARLRKRGA